MATVLSGVLVTMVTTPQPQALQLPEHLGSEPTVVCAQPFQTATGPRHESESCEPVGFGTAVPSRYSTLEFRLAYGGLQVEHEVLRRGRWTVGAAGTLAYGRFSVEDTQADTEQSTGVWLAEPEVFAGVYVVGRVRFTVSGSHRWARGVEGDIPNRSDGDARGPSLTLRMAVR